ncbi:hypothetical protein LCGC14_0899650 [marine sediment metagenome]|uniref:HTH arsR-type domain-containing protein n=1 Tax=marine sediment metagenome TaxID=412755 RepID=A0A0F9PHJ2_9ZZZZ
MNPTIEDILSSRTRVKILKALAIKEELTISLLVKETKSNHFHLRKHLNYLKKVDFFEEKTYGRIKIFRYKTENIKALSFKRFIYIFESELKDT